MYYVPKTAIRWRVGVPASILLVLCILHLIPIMTMIATIGGEILRSGRIPYHIWNDGFVWGCFSTLPSVIGVLVGMYQMSQVRNLVQARIAAWLACVPGATPCFIVGIPFGIWALIILFLPSTVAEFERVKNPVPDEDLPAG
jgi:hypothetical protein